MDFQTLSMTEKLLQFIWQFRYFSQHELFLESGERIYIIFPGQLNNNQGPDFLHAKIKIEDTIWIGHIELHLHAADWKKHAHEDDKNYSNVMLHVVWENDATQLQRNIPTLVLQQKIPKLLLDQYKEWMDSISFIPCKKNIKEVSDIVWLSWKQRLIVERLQRKSIIIMEYLRQNHEHWEETLWWLIAANFGIKVNAAAFEAIARTIPTKLLSKHKNQIHQLEALLLGQAGLLEADFKESYPRLLKKEYCFLKNKYHLKAICETVHFLRMRPVNFPTIRLSQLAALIHKSSHLFSRIKEIKTVAEIKQLLEVTANDYWHYHYIFDEPSAFKKKIVGRQMIENIIINTIIPVLYAYGSLHKHDACKSKSLEWLEALAAEKNSVVTQWKEIKIETKNASDTQALLELKTQYCDNKKCLDCAIGNSLLKGMNNKTIIGDCR